MYLVATGCDEDAIKVLLSYLLIRKYSTYQESFIQSLEYIARRNGKGISLNLEDLLALSESDGREPRESVVQILRQSFRHFSL